LSLVVSGSDYLEALRLSWLWADMSPLALRRAWTNRAA
jgi:hypothetical protein